MLEHGNVQRFETCGFHHIEHNARTNGHVEQRNCDGNACTYIAEENDGYRCQHGIDNIECIGFDQRKIEVADLGSQYTCLI